MADPTPTQAESDALHLQAMGVDPAHFPPVPVDAPAVGGGSAPGATLTCTMGNWTNEPTGYAYSWRAGNANLGTDETYVITEEDVGREICCLVTASNAYGSTMGAPSNKVTVAAGAARSVEKEESRHEVRHAPAPAHRR